jgi:signal peptidase
MPFQPEELLTRGSFMPDVLPSRSEVQLDLAAEILRQFGEVRFVARGSSMLPAIYPGDLLTIRSEAMVQARCGEIVLCLRDGRFWIHRVTRKWREGGLLVFATRGDALTLEDPTVEENQLLGRVTSIVRRGKLVDLARRNGPWMKLLRWGVRNSGVVAKSLLRWHSLRARILGGAPEALENPREQSAECV